MRRRAPKIRKITLTTSSGGGLWTEETLTSTENTQPFNNVHIHNALLYGTSSMEVEHHDWMSLGHSSLGIKSEFSSLIDS